MSRSVSSSGAKALDVASVPALSARDIAVLSRAEETRWRPGLTDQPLHSEIFAEAEDASGAGLALAFARDALAATAQRGDPLAVSDDCRQVLWVQEARAAQRSGRPNIHGLPLALRDRLIHVEAKTPEDALFVLEEGLRCRDLACVIGEMVGNPRVLDFTASRRLSLAAEKHGTALWLVRLDAQADLSSARMRWRTRSATSSAPHWNPAAPGAPAWAAELFRARSHAPGEWTLSNDDGHLAVRHSIDWSEAAQEDPRDLVRPTVDRSLAAVAKA